MCVRARARVRVRLICLQGSADVKGDGKGETMDEDKAGGAVAGTVQEEKDGAEAGSNGAVAVSGGEEAGVRSGEGKSDKMDDDARAGDACVVWCCCVCGGGGR